MKLWYLIKDVLSRLRWPQLFQQISYYHLQNAIISSEKTVHVMRYQKFLTAVLLLLEEKKLQEGKNLPVVALVSATAAHHVHSATCLQSLTVQVKLAKVKGNPFLLQPTCFKRHKANSLHLQFTSHFTQVLDE